MRSTNFGYAEGGLVADIEDDDYLTTLAAAEGYDDEYETPEDVAAISSGFPTPSGILAQAGSPDLDRASKHLQGVMDGLIRRAEMQQMSQSNWTPAAWMALASGLLSPTKSGGFGESVGYAAGNVAPVFMKQDAERRAATDKLDQLRLMAAKIDVSNETNKVKAVQSAAALQQRRLDSLAKVGLTLDENGRYVIDQGLVDAQASRAGSIAEAQAKARQKYRDTSDDPSSQTPLSDEEIKQWGFRPGTVAVMTAKGPKVLQAPTATQMVFSGKYDAEGNKVFEPADTTLTPSAKKNYVATLETGKKILPHLNYMIDEIESGRIGQEAFGVGAGAADVANVTLGQVTGKTINQKGLAFRDQMGLLNEADIKKYFSRDPSRPSNQEAKDVSEFLPSTGWFESKGSALSKMKQLRERVMSNMRDAGTTLGEEGIDDIVNDYGTRIKRQEVAPPKSAKTKTKKSSGVQFPLTVRKGNQIATVANEAELKEAQEDGFLP